MPKRTKPPGAAPTTSRGPTPPWPVYFRFVIPILWAAILLALEAGLRLAGFGTDPGLFSQVDPGLLVDNSAYTERFYSHRDGYEPVQKSNLFAAEKRPGRLRIFVVGGSTAQGYPFQRNHGFTGIAAAALRAVGVDVEILNLGNSAMTSYYVREVLHEVRKYAPDMVVVYAGHNEYYGTPSSFTGGNHASRLALLGLKRFRTVQLLERPIRALRTDRVEEMSRSLMARRFESSLHPADPDVDGAVVELFVRNLDAGLRSLRKAGVHVAIFEPVSNLISMPPFRSTATEGTADTASALALYQRARTQLEAGVWDREAWERVKDLDEVPFRARSRLVEALGRYARSDSSITWVPTAAELERQRGPWAFSDTLFIDHLHFKFEGQVLLAEMLARSVVDRFFFADEDLLARLEEYLADRARARADVHLTDFWELEAYTRVISMQRHEPFASMPLPKSPPEVPERVMRNARFLGREFIDSLEGESPADLFYLAMDYYKQRGERDEWIRNMNAYVYLFPGHYQSHLAYAVALIEDDAIGHVDQAGAYIRRAYALSDYSPEVAEVARKVLESHGLGAAWERFRQVYLARDG